MKKILLIEDNQDIRENTGEILELANYKVTLAENGREGITHAMKEKPDLIICDIMMPDLDGYGVLHLLSKNESLADIPFIFMTAKADRSDYRKGMEMGADDYITKPFDDIELLNAIEARLKKSAILRNDFSQDLAGLSSFLSIIKGVDTGQELSIQEDFDTRNCQKKEVIYQEGKSPKGIYFLAKGKVKSYRTNDQGKEFITELYSEGDFFGYAPLMEGGKYCGSAAALEIATICFIPQETFFALLYRNSNVSRKFIQLLSNNLKEKEERLINLAYNSVRKRVSDALVTLSQRYPKENGADADEITISREDLANLAGTATETTIRTLSDFKEENLISIDRGTITLLNVGALAALRN
jgi:DNA-binding response OmpR family regulator